jgi:hypothetical protein
MHNTPVLNIVIVITNSNVNATRVKTSIDCLRGSILGSLLTSGYVARRTIMPLANTDMTIQVLNKWWSCTFAQRSPAATMRLRMSVRSFIFSKVTFLPVNTVSNVAFNRRWVLTSLTLLWASGWESWSATNPVFESTFLPDCHNKLDMLLRGSGSSDETAPAVAVAACSAARSFARFLAICCARCCAFLI